MKELAETDLVEIGRKAAAEVPGLGTVDRIKVAYGQDSSEQPAYVFTFLIDRDRDPAQRGLTRIRLIQRLSEALEARDDTHYPVVRVHNQADWDLVEGA